MNIAIDIDGVLADFTSAYAKRIVKVTGENKFPKPLVIPCWDWDVHYGYSKDQIAATWEDITKDGLFWQKLDPIPDRDVFARLNVLAKTNPMYFITNRMGLNCKQQTEKFLYNHGIDYPTVLIASNKQPIIDALKVEFFVDDRLETMNELVIQRKRDHFYLKDASYNQIGRALSLQVAANIKDALMKAGLW